MRSFSLWRNFSVNGQLFPKSNCRWFSTPNNTTTKQEEKERRREPLTPDFTTSVNVGDIRLSRPSSLPPSLSESLIPETLKNMENDSEFIDTADRLRRLGAAQMSLEERKKRRRALKNLSIPNFEEYLQKNQISVTRKSPQILQLNIGLYCNQACNHCHVESSPKRTEMMTSQTADHCLRLLRNSKTVTTLDITGGAPELNPVFRYLVNEASKTDVQVIDRCNLTVLEEPGQEDLVDFLASKKVQVVASLPCYSQKNVNLQRGGGVFQRSIRGLKKLNSAGYGQEGSGLTLDLVYNPLGAFLPPPQEPLEEKYKQELWDQFEIKFNNLFAFNNMPIKRFADFLYRRGELQEYMDLLVRNFNINAPEGLMCRDTISVGWDGKIYDCDFNQQLGMQIGTEMEGEKEREGGVSVDTLESLQDLKHPILFDAHCYGCTAGAGSSCQGATIED